MSNKKKGLIIAGIIFGVFTLLFVGCVAFVGIIGSSLETETSSTPAADNAKAKTEAKQKAQPVAKIGDKVKAGDVAYRVDKIEHKGTLKNILGTKKPGSGEFLVLHLTVWNEGKEPITLDSTMTQLIDKEGAKYDPDSEAVMYLYKNGETPFLENINPNGSKKFLVAFDVAKGKEYDFIGSNALIFSDAQVRINLK